MQGGGEGEVIKGAWLIEVGGGLLSGGGHPGFLQEVV